MKWYTQIVNTKSKKITLEMGPFNSERQAECCENGANINLNHDSFHTVVLQKKEKE